MWLSSSISIYRFILRDFCTVIGYIHRETYLGNASTREWTRTLKESENDSIQIKTRFHNFFGIDDTSKANQNRMKVCQPQRHLLLQSVTSA